jgi:hypothetical protein
MHLKEGEEKTAVSDPRIRFSSGGPISLDPDMNNFFTIFASDISIMDVALGRGWGGGGGGGLGWEGGQYILHIYLV